ncbi:c-type cytochrome [Alcaligenaceae bacterium CGII-47]|nr:c-type cytochrome [Alcaligenaceae bacterium CGII-47]
MFIFYRYIVCAGLALTLALLVPGTPYAAPLSGQELARAKQCLACHQVQTKRVGPPFAAIAQRFGGQADAADHLARVIREGSSGQWGAIPMPAQNQVSAFDAQRLALWILSLPAPKN